MDYITHVMTLVILYGAVAVALDILVGETGLVSLSAAAFYGVGAYTAALLAIHVHTSFLFGMLCGTVAGGTLALLVAAPMARLRGDYFILATFGVQMIVFALLNNLGELTRGPLGLSGIPLPAILGVTIRPGTAFLVMAAGYAAAVHFITRRVVTGNFGRVLHAIREDEILAQSLGRNTAYFKATVWVISAAMIAGSGVLYAHYSGYIDPHCFTINESIMVIAMVIIGGAGSRFGPLIGAALLVALPEALRFVGMPEAVAAHLRQVVYGGLLTLTIALRPRGLVGRYDFGSR